MIGIAAGVDVADLKETTLLNMGIFGLFVAVTMVIVLRASPRGWRALSRRKGTHSRRLF